MSVRSLTKWSVIGAAILIFAGCNSQAGTKSTGDSGTSVTNQGQQGEHAHHDSEHAHGDGANEALSPMEKMEVGLANLSAEDAAAARKQHVCPVSGEMIGVMGPPIKVTVKGQDVWICCEGCRQKLLDNPDEYLAKLNP
ncbi:MAG: hypothetical protein CMJ58_06285 [Planctomycetaceae bacterium]|nr:hypothetical protein [Planctomycetaceae bacterium]